MRHAQFVTYMFGDILGIGFDVAPTYKALLSASDIAGTQVPGLFQNTRSCGQGCNFNGIISDIFDSSISYMSYSP